MGNYSGRATLVEECPKIQVSKVLQVAKQQLLPVLMENITGMVIETVIFHVVLKKPRN